jgi:hypothetical protein
MSATPQTASDGPAPALVQALRRLLRPLVRLLLAHQVTFPFLAGLLKEVYVDVAEHDFRLEQKAQTDSRVSLLTGIHRKDVRRLRGVSPADAPTPSSVSLGTAIVTRWTTDERWLDEAGRPRPLPRQAPGRAASFESLVGSVSRDIRPRAVLDEWLRLGVAHLDEAGCVQLDASAFIPSKGFDEKAFYFGRNVGDHIAAGAHNLLGEQPPFVDRSLFYDGLGAESIEELRRMSESEGMRALQTVSRRALALQ